MRPFHSGGLLVRRRTKSLRPQVVAIHVTNPLLIQGSGTYNLLRCVRLTQQACGVAENLS